METLLRLAECGHYETVKALFDFPIKHCPDVLVLALLQTNVSLLLGKTFISAMLVARFSCSVERILTLLLLGVPTVLVILIRYS